ncbi:hypothetical protein JCM5353_004303 [Sporobolomyces roseus]
MAFTQFWGGTRYVWSRGDYEIPAFPQFGYTKGGGDCYWFSLLSWTYLFGPEALLGEWMEAVERLREATAQIFEYWVGLGKTSIVLGQSLEEDPLLESIDDRGSPAAVAIASREWRRRATWGRLSYTTEVLPPPRTISKLEDTSETSWRDIYDSHPFATGHDTAGGQILASAAMAGVPVIVIDTHARIWLPDPDLPSALKPYQRDLRNPGEPIVILQPLGHYTTRLEDAQTASWYETIKGKKMVIKAEHLSSMTREEYERESADWGGDYPGGGRWRTLELTEILVDDPIPGSSATSRQLPSSSSLPSSSTLPSSSRQEDADMAERSESDGDLPFARDSPVARRIGQNRPRGSIDSSSSTSQAPRATSAPIPRRPTIAELAVNARQEESNSTRTSRQELGTPRSDLLTEGPTSKRLISSKRKGRGPARKVEDSKNSARDGAKAGDKATVPREALPEWLGQGGELDLVPPPVDPTVPLPKYKFTDLTQNATVKLNSAKAPAKKKTRRKDDLRADFATMVSHELLKHDYNYSKCVNIESVHNLELMVQDRSLAIYPEDQEERKEFLRVTDWLKYLLRVAMSASEIIDASYLKKLRQDFRPRHLKPGQFEAQSLLLDGEAKLEADRIRGDDDFWDKVDLSSVIGLSNAEVAKYNKNGIKTKDELLKSGKLTNLQRKSLAYPTKDGISDEDARLVLKLLQYALMGMNPIILLDMMLAGRVRLLFNGQSYLGEFFFIEESQRALYSVFLGSSASYGDALYLRALSRGLVLLPDGIWGVAQFGDPDAEPFEEIDDEKRVFELLGLEYIGPEGRSADGRKDAWTWEGKSRKDEKEEEKDES